MHATYFGANGWLLELGPLRVLVDPWLTGPLQFPPGPWFFQGELAQEQPAPTQLDLLLLTQGLDDHCHPASLALLPPELPVVGSASRSHQLWPWARRLARNCSRCTAWPPWWLWHTPLGHSIALRAMGQRGWMGPGPFRRSSNSQ